MKKYISISNIILSFVCISCVSLNKNIQNKNENLSSLFEKIASTVYFNDIKKIKCFGINLFNADNPDHEILSKNIDIFNISGTETQLPFYIIKIQNKNEEILISELHNLKNKNKEIEYILNSVKNTTPRKLINTESIIIPMQKNELFFDYSNIKTSVLNDADSVILNVKTKPIRFIFDKPYIILYKKLSSEKPYKVIFHLSAKKLIEDNK